MQVKMKELFCNSPKRMQGCRLREMQDLESKGEYIGFVDPDDWIAPEMYEQMIFCDGRLKCGFGNLWIRLL